MTARNEAAPNTRTSQLHKDPPNVFFFFFPQTRSARRVNSGEFGVSSDPVCSFQAVEGWPKRTKSVRGPRNERPPSPPTPQFSFLSPCFFNFASALPGHPAAFPISQALGRRKGGHKPLSSKRLSESLREWPVVASFRTPGSVSYLPSSQRSSSRAT